MASLKFIMDVDDDQSDPPPSSRSNKKDKEPSASSAQLHRSQGPSSGSIPTGHVPTAAVADHYADDSHLSPATAPPTTSSSGSGSGSGKRRAALGRAAKSSSSSTPASSSTPLSSAQAPEARRRSTTSTDSMDQTGYMSSSSMGGGGGSGAPNHPIRPMPPSTSGSELPLKLTPITGRVSRAKKGVPVHTCDVCKPPKTFTRAEHLRRHQLSHQNPAFTCTHPGCDRQFHRADLLARHQQKHDQEPIRFDAAAVPPRGGQGRRDSSQSLVDGASRMGLQHPGGSSSGGPGSTSSGLGAGASTPVSNSDIPPTPTRNSATPSQQRGPGGPGGHAPMSPSIGGSRDYGASGNRYGTEYVTDAHPQTSLVYPPGITTPVSAGPNLLSSAFEVPRTPGNLQLYVVTDGLTSNAHHLDSNPPELHLDVSPWASSTDSSYSTTPAVDHIRNRRYGSWAPRQSSPPLEWHQQPGGMLFPNPAAGVRDAVALDAVATPYFYSTIHPSPQVMPPHSQGPHNSYSSFLEVPMAGYSDPHPMLGDAQPHPPASSVRSPSPIAATTVSAETLVTPSTALPADRLSMLAALGRQKEVVMEGGSVGMYASMPFGGGSGNPGGILAAQGLPGGVGCGGGGIVLGVPMPLTNTVRRAIPGYIDVYWARFHEHFPIIHRPSFETAGGEEVLRCAMAAVATQLLDGKEDRNRGNLLHEFAWQEAKRCPQLNLQVMQAILICEFFARFRGRKAAIKPSKLFDHVYSTVLDCDTNPVFPPEAGADSASSAAAGAAADLPVEQRWQTWVDAEARRRLLAACFLLDVHTSLYHEQGRVRHFDLSDGRPPPVFLTGPTTALWDAPTAETFVLALASNPAAQPTLLPPCDVLTAETARTYSVFDRKLILAAAAAGLPRRHPQAAGPGSNHPDLPPLSAGGAEQHQHQHQNQHQHQQLLQTVHPAEVAIARVFPDSPIANTYLALHHTPLLDLLAVSGDSWVFSHKVLPEGSFLEHKKRLKTWAAASAGRAATYAARALCAFLSSPPSASSAPSSSSSSLSTSAHGHAAVDLSEYWAVYVCTLICWAFGHRAVKGGEAAARGLGGDDEVLGWLRVVGSMGEDDWPRVRARREAVGVVGVVRRRLEVECLGAKSRLFVDTVGVLKKLEEGITWRWF